MNDVIKKAISKKRAALKKEIAIELHKVVSGKMDDETFKKSKLFEILKNNADLDIASLDIADSPNSFLQKLAIWLGIETVSSVNIAKKIEVISDKIVRTEAAKEVINLEVRVEEDNRHWYLNTISTKDGKHKLGLYFRDSIIGLADFFVAGSTSKNAPYEKFIESWNNACDKENVPFFKVKYDANDNPKVKLILDRAEIVKSIAGKEMNLTFEQNRTVINIIRAIEEGLNDIVDLKNEDLKLNTLHNAGDLTPKERIIKGLTIAAVCLLAAGLLAALTLIVAIPYAGFVDVLYIHTAMTSFGVSAKTAFEIAFTSQMSLSVIIASRSVVEVGLSIATAFEKPYVGSENKEVFASYKNAVERIEKSLDEFAQLPLKKELSEKEQADFEKAKGFLEKAKAKITSAAKEINELRDGLAASAIGR